MTPADHDVVIVGAGSAGSVVAQRLILSGARVLLLEAGPDPGPAGSGRWPADVLNADRVATSHDWGYAGPAADGRVLPHARARILGGSSAHNGCTQSIGWAADYDQWGHPELTGSAMARAAPAILAALRVHTPAAASLPPLQRQVLGGALGEGHRQTNDLLDINGGPGACVSPVNVTGGVRWNSAFGFLDPVRARNGLTVLGDALVDRIEFADGRINAVQAIVAGVRCRFATSAVVLCAGAFGTPEVLLRSGIGPAAQLAEVGVTPLVDLPGVGTGMTDHPVIAPSVAASEPLSRRLSGLQAAGMAVPDEGVVVKLASGSDPEAGPYDLHLFPWTERDPDRPHGWSVVLGVGLLRPRSRGRLRLRSPDPMVRADIDLGYLREADDADRLAAGLRQALLIAQHADVDRQDIGQVARVLDGGSQPVRAWVRSRHIHYWHPVGGASFGEPDDGGVIDQTFSVYGVRGVHVADAAAFPSPPRATTALPVSLLAAQCANVMTRG